MAAGDWLEGQGRDPTEVLVTHNYVVVETAALVHRRLGAAAVRVLFEAFVPALSLFFVDEQLHERASSAYLAASRRSPSFVDWVSFQMIRDQNLDRAFAFDRDFRNEGLTVVP